MSLTEVNLDSLKYLLGFTERYKIAWGFPDGSVVKNLPAVQETCWIPGMEDPLEEEMATRSSILAGKVPWTEEPGGYSPKYPKELDTTEWLSMHTCIRLLTKFMRRLEDKQPDIKPQTTSKIWPHCHQRPRLTSSRMPLNRAGIDHSCPQQLSCRTYRCIQSWQSALPASVHH